MSEQAPLRFQRRHVDALFAKTEELGGDETEIATIRNAKDVDRLDGFELLQRSEIGRKASSRLNGDFEKEVGESLTDFLQVLGSKIGVSFRLEIVPEEREKLKML